MNSQSQHWSKNIDQQQQFLPQMKLTAKRFNQIREKPSWFAANVLPLEATLVRKWSDDLLKLKRLICALPLRLQMSPNQFFEFQQSDRTLPSWAAHDPMRWVSSFFRPDCILTAEGLKVIEFNIDNGSLSIFSGIAAKSYYQLIPGFNDWLNQIYGSNLSKSVFTEEVVLDYFLKGQANGKKIIFWDLAERSVDIAEERRKEIDFLKKKGVSIDLLVGDEILTVQKKSGIFIFRYFAYVHFFNSSNGMQEIFRKLNPQLFTNSDLGLSSVLYDNKVNLALLWDPRTQSLLTDEEIELVKTYIPRSACVQAANPEASGNKNQWVLKKGIGFQGKNVVVGSETDSSDWSHHLQQAAKEGGYILQEAVTPLRLPFNLTDGEKQLYSVDSHILNMYFADNQYSGMLFRLKADGTEKKVGAIDARSVVVGMPVINRS